MLVNGATGIKVISSALGNWMSVQVFVIGKEMIFIQVLELLFSSDAYLVLWKQTRSGRLHNQSQLRVVRT